MSGSITRRDFLNGVALGVAAGALPGAAGAALATAGPGAYPPALDGFRGAAEGTWNAAHALRDGSRLPIDDATVDETVDLVVVGAGISGLAAAWFHRREHPRARILLLDPLDDFGGHAQRNEFVVGSRRLVSYGGSESLQSPKSLYSPVALELLAALGVDVDRFETAFDRELYPGLGLSRGVLFKREHFGTDRLVTGDPQRMVADDVPPGRMNARPVAEFIADFPVSEASRRRLVELYTSDRDPLAGMARDEKQRVLERTSYRDWLLRRWGLEEQAADTFHGRTLDFFATPTDAVPAAWAMETGYPGFRGLGLRDAGAASPEMDDPYIHHFPDGNASLARLLVRSLIPGVAPGRGMEDVVLAPFDYSRLDEQGARVRLRLGSTVLRVRNGGTPTSAGVETVYVRDGRVHGVRSRHVVLACWHTMSRYLVPELGDAQRVALASNVKAPLVYVKVAVRDWRPWVRRGVHEVTNPMGFYSRLKLDYPVSLGGYEFPRSPDQPMVLHLVHVPTAGEPRDDLRSRFRAARAQLEAMPFAAFESAARDELARIAGPGGFDPDRDIAAITVNRWGHGYAYGGNPLYDPPPPGGREPAEVARAPAGRIAFANSDSAGSAYAHAAIDEADRAIRELR